MKAALCLDKGALLTIDQVQISKPGPHEVLLRTIAAGLCHSDLHAIDGKVLIPYPIILGHEAAAIVEEVGENVRYVSKGDHVITTMQGFCGHCHPCLDGDSLYCDSDRELRRTKGEAPRLSWRGQKLIQFGNISGFAEQLLVHENHTIKITKEMPLDIAALIGCGVTTGVGAVLRTAQVPVGSSVAIFGCGGIGLSAINGAAIAGAGRIFAVDVFDSKLELAKSMGATDLINSKNTDAVAAIMEMSKGGVDYSFEAVGLQQTLAAAYEVLKPRGTATVMGVFGHDEKVSIPGSGFLKEKRLQGSYLGSRNHRVEMPKYVDLYLKGKLHLDLLVSDRLPLDRINEGFAAMRRGGAARTIIAFDA